MATINSFPNNYDEYIGAEEVMRWLHGRTSGVYGADGNAAVTAVSSTMNVSVSPGIGWITDSAGNGIVWWSSAAQTLAIDPAHSTLNRIDRVIVEWYVSDYSTKPEIRILKGTNASTPTAPALTNNNLYRQLSLARVSVPAGTTEITAALITDERLDPTVCGVVTETVAVDTTTINAQFQAFLESIREELEDLQAGTAVELKKLMFTNVSVAKTTFVSDSTYTDYPYRAAVTLTGAIAGMVPEVIFSLEDAVSGSFAPVAQSYNGGVYIYADGQPSAAITIPTIILWRENS
jgi:hypothetical protein